MYKLNNISFSDYGITAGRVRGEGIAIKGIFDLPKRHGDTHHSWAEANSVEPYVDADEIFLSGRDIFFQGVMLGDKATLTTNIESLKTAIADFNSVVPLETPYGNACVLVRKITPKIYKGGASILIEFREPEVGASCSVSEEETVYYSEEFSATAEKNDCESGFHGSEVELTAEAGMFTSTVSQEAANLLAQNWVYENVQAYANANGTCIANPVVYWNTTLKGSLQKNNCPLGFTGTIVVYIVEAFSYSSEISQADADAQAQAEMDEVLTQAYANENGTCVEQGLSTFTFIYSDILPETEGGFPAREVVFEVGPEVRGGSIFSITMYGVTKSITASNGFSPADVVNQLVIAINNTTESQWDANDQAPNHGYNFPPVASLEGTNRLKILMNYENNAYHSVFNP